MNTLYKSLQMPKKFMDAVETIMEYCQNEDCDDDCSQCPHSLAEIRCGDIVDILDKIRAEIKGKYRIVLKGTPKDDWAVRWNDCVDEVLQIIDKYKVGEEE